ncbi:unnamed protein product [Owenia fusiformis]|uniref:Uncharacterized protein n=1 Tax=Owenia fusiformis TaxID=6347 RepID=A0A8J1XL83_OWEFU|nr:unnamed protein product [Owenia fusiformis]
MKVSNLTRNTLLVGLVVFIMSQTILISIFLNRRDTPYMYNGEEDKVNWTSYKYLHDRGTHQDSKIKMPSQKNFAQKFLTIFTTFSEREHTRFQIQNNTLCNYEQFPNDLTERVIFASDTFHLREDGPCGKKAKNGRDFEWNFVTLRPNMTAAGRPVLRQMFIESQSRFNSDLYMYTNGDILFNFRKLMGSLKAIERFTKVRNIKRYIIFGGRRELNFYHTDNKTVEQIEIGSDEEIDAYALVSKSGRIDAQDYIITSKSSFPWEVVPDYVVSLPAFDNWLLMYSNKANIATFDITLTTVALHQAGVPKLVDKNYNESAKINLQILRNSIENGVGIRNTFKCCKWKTMYHLNQVKIIKSLTYRSWKCISELKIPVFNLMDNNKIEEQ